MGSIEWSDYKELFSYATGGLKGIALIIVLHFAINSCAMGVSLFLAFFLTHKLENSGPLSSDEKSSRDT